MASCNCYHLLLFLVTSVWATELCEPWRRVEIVNSTLLADNSLFDPEIRSVYPKGTYWKEEVKTFGCPCMLEEKPCLRKCCLKNEAMDYDHLHCHSYNATFPWFRPNITADSDGGSRQEDEYYFGLIYGKFCSGYLLEPYSYEIDKFYVNFTNGILHTPLKKRHYWGPEDYCVEYLPMANLYLPYLCFDTIGSKHPLEICYRIRYILYPIGMIISILFLGVSFALYLILPELRNHHGKCMMCHILTLMIAYISLVIVQGIGEQLSPTMCMAFGFVIYFSMMSSVFWLNIMSIDIFMAFSSMKARKGRGPKRDKKRLLLYMLYAWGLPLIFIIVTATLELYPNVPSSFIKPSFKETCWFQSDQAKMAYFIGPFGFMVVCNMCLFMATARNIFKLKKETQMLNLSDSKRHSQREEKSRFKLYLKLSLVMGLSWMMEVLALLIGGSDCVWFLTDLVNTLQGAFIFLIFLCKKRVKYLLFKKYAPDRLEKEDKNTESFQQRNSSH